MLTMVTSLRAKALADNWLHHVTLLEHVLRSMLSNTGSFRIVVVCHDVPHIPGLSHQNITFLPVDFDVPKRVYNDMLVDKVLKLSIGTQWALERGTDYVMFTDADDLLNRQIVSFVEQNEGQAGWYSSLYYSWTHGSRYYRAHTSPPGTSNACAIFRRDLVLEFDRPPFRTKWTDFVSHDEQLYLDLLAARKREVNVLAAVGLEYYVRLIALDGQQLRPFPFVSILKLSHDDSTVHVSGGKGSLMDLSIGDSRPTWRRLASSVKAAVRDLSRLRPIGRTIRQDFSL